MSATRGAPARASGRPSGRAACRAAVLGLLLAASCSSINRTNGYMPDAELVDELRPGVHDMDSVATLLGTPTSRTSFDHNHWYYIYRRSEQVAFFEQKLVEQSVLELRFDRNGVLQDITRYSLDDSRDIEPVDRVTPTRGKELTVVEQLFGNIGRFSGQENNQ